MLWVKNGKDVPRRAFLAAFYLGAFILVAGCTHRDAFPEEITLRVNEITAVQSSFRLPVPDYSGKRLAFAHDVSLGRRLFICDLNTLETRQIPGTNEITQIFGWSHDGRFLAFAQAPPVKPQNNDELKVTWLTLYDTQTDRAERVGTNENVAEGSATWLHDGRLFYSLHKLGSDYTEKFIMDPVTRSTAKVRNYISDFALMETNTGVIFQDGDLYACLIDTTNYPPIYRLSDFSSYKFEQMRWLRYRPETGSFLFCARAKNSEWRCLYQFDPRSKELKQLTIKGAYNGQFLGDGFAYVGNTNNEFYLGLRPANPNLATNLFRGGNVVTYVTSPDGSHVYAIASEKVEPPGVWDYEVANGKLRKLVSGQPAPWQAARLIEPQAKWATSFDGLTVPYFTLPPTELSATPSNTNKFPVILYLPPATWQFQRGFDLTAELYANLNCWYLPVNYRGGDGYGRTYNEFNNTADAARDAQVVLAEFATNANVNLQRVLLTSESSGAAEVMELLRQTPGKWLGAILRHPSLDASMVESLPTNTPPLFIVAGSLERSVLGLEKFVEAAQDKGLSARLYIQKDCGHEIFSTDELRNTLIEELKFYQSVNER